MDMQYNGCYLRPHQGLSPQDLARGPDLLHPPILETRFYWFNGCTLRTLVSYIRDNNRISNYTKLTNRHDFLGYRQKNELLIHILVLITSTLMFSYLVSLQAWLIRFKSQSKNLNTLCQNLSKVYTINILNCCS